MNSSPVESLCSSHKYISELLVARKAMIGHPHIRNYGPAKKKFYLYHTDIFISFAINVELEFTAVLS